MVHSSMVNNYFRKHVFDFIKQILANVITKFNDKGGKLTTTQIIIFERVVISILRLYVRMISREDVRAQLDLALDLLNTIPETMLTFVLPQICSGILMLVKTNGKNIPYVVPLICNRLFVNRNAKVWDTLLRYLKLGATDKDAVPKSNEATLYVATEGDFIWPDNINSCVNSLMTHTSQATPELLYSLHSRMFDYAPSVSNPSPSMLNAFFTICSLDKELVCDCRRCHKTMLVY